MWFDLILVTPTWVSVCPTYVLVLTSHCTECGLGRETYRYIFCLEDELVSH